MNSKNIGRLVLLTLLFPAHNNTEVTEGVAGSESLSIYAQGQKTIQPLPSPGIPDRIAYEALLMSIAESPEHTENGRQREEARVSALVKRIELEPKDAVYLLTCARRFAERKSVWDKEAQEIKGKAWPAIDNAMGQLLALQKLKAQLIEEISSSIQENIAAGSYVKLRAYIEETVKPNIKILSLVDENKSPNKLQSEIGLAYSYNATCHAFERLEVYGWCAVIADYTSRGYRYRINCSNAGAGGIPSTSARSGYNPAPFSVLTVTPLCLGGPCYDGTFTTRSEVEENNSSSTAR